MLERNDQRMLWKYVDGLVTAEEKKYVQERLRSDEQFSRDLRSMQILDANLLQGEIVRLPEALKVQILTKTEKVGRTQIIQTPGFDKKGLISFATFNLAILGLGILIAVFNAGWSSGTPQWSILTDFYEIIETPMIRSFFLVCTAVLGLLFLDHFLKNWGYGKTTTPV
jgi:hypothetical protein